MQYEFGTDRRTGEEAETAGYASSVPRYLVALCMSILGTCYNNEMTASSDSGSGESSPAPDRRAWCLGCRTNWTGRDFDAGHLLLFRA